MEMHQLQTIARWDVIVPKPYTFHDSHVLIYSFNTRSLPLYENDVFSNYNLKTAHILCLNETHFNTLMFNNTSLNIDTRTHSMISVNGRNGTMIIYDNFTTLSSHKTFTSLGVEYIL
jgi:exonuclease III